MSEIVEFEAHIATPTGLYGVNLSKDTASGEMVEIAVNEGSSDGVVHPARVGIVLKPYVLAKKPLMMAIIERDRDDPTFEPVRYDFALRADGEANAIKMQRLNTPPHRVLGVLTTQHIRSMDKERLENYRNNLVRIQAKYN